MTYDYSADREPIGANLMAQLKAEADKQEKLEAEIAELERQLELKQAEHKEISEKTLPQLLDGVMGNLRLDDGRSIEITEKIRASIAGTKADPACDWLDNNGHSSIIKRQFVIEFGKEDEAWAKKFEADLRKRKKPVNVKRKRTVHPQTLEAFVREQLAHGVNIPKDLFGVYRQRKSKVTRPEPIG